LPDAFRRAVVVIGNFDGVHLGHRALIAEAKAQAGKAGAALGVLTFEPHPRRVLRPEEPFFALLAGEDRHRLLREAGADFVVSLTFDAALMAMSALDFAGDLLTRRLAAAHVVVGADFRYGRGREGDVVRLTADGSRFGFAVHPVEKLSSAGDIVSSSAVRGKLSGGDVTGAAKLLGYWWFVRGKVAHGDKRGRELGYPTANLLLDPACRLAYGIYAVRAFVDGKRLNGAASFGSRPTFDNGAPRLETFLFDFSGDLYDKPMAVEFIALLRGEEKFASLEALIAQMDRDCAEARAAIAAAPQAIRSVIGKA
jgi:riboflavin kinase/FMN adenylyltransferase